MTQVCLQEFLVTFPRHVIAVERELGVVVLCSTSTTAIASSYKVAADRQAAAEITHECGSQHGGLTEGVVDNFLKMIPNPTDNPSGADRGWKHLIDLATSGGWLKKHSDQRRSH